MNLFAGKMKFNDDDELDLVEGVSPRENFDDLSNAVVSLFEVFIGGGWSNIMFIAIRAKGQVSAFYFVILVVTGTIILMNLFLSIMLGTFDKAR
jgi:hypothetical protein